MLEKMKSVSNPLTIIGLFCGVVEVAGLIVMGTGNIAPEGQRDLLWLVKWFPVLLVSMFFVTLWFKDRVLYAPGDFKDEQNYLALASANAKQSLGIEKVQAMIAEAKTDIINEVMKTMPANGTGDRDKVEEIVNDKLQPVQDAVDKVRDDILSRNQRRLEKAEAVLRLLLATRESMTLKEIASKLYRHPDGVRKTLFDLISLGYVEEELDKAGIERYVATNYDRIPPGFLERI